MSDTGLHKPFLNPVHHHHLNPPSSPRLAEAPFSRVLRDSSRFSKVPQANDGTIEFVAPESIDKFKAEGKACLVWNKIQEGDPALDA